MSILRYLTSCMSRSKGSVNADEFMAHNYGNTDLDIFYVNEIPTAVKDLLVYIAREGVAVTDLFRRPGNIQHINKVIHQLKIRETVDWSKYNFYTLANIAKRFLRQIDKGVLGEQIELELINALDLSDDQSRIEEMSRVLNTLSREVLELLALLFGTWFRMIYHSEVNAMSVEAVAKSVAGSIFPSCTNDPIQVNRASKVMEYLITGFASSELFGIELIEYFTNETKTSISRIEKFKYEFVYPKNVSKKKSTRLFVRMLIDESIKHGFDLLKNEVTEDQFNATDNCAIITGNFPEESSTIPFSNNPDGDNKTRKRRLSKTYPPNTSNPIVSNNDQVQQTSEKRTCVVASSTDIGLTTTTSTLEFDMTQECSHHNKSTTRTNGDHILYPSHTSDSSSPVDKRKSARLEVSGDVRLDEIIKSELQKMDNRKTGDEGFRGQNGPASGGRFSKVKRQQLERLQKRSDWFLSPPSGCKSEALMQLSPTSPAIRDPPLSIASDNCTMSGNFELYDLLNNKIDESNSNSARDSQNNDIVKLNIASNNISTSDPTLFRSADSGTNEMIDSKSKDVTSRPSSNILEDETEVRYFVVYKYYGPLASRSDPREE